MEVSWHLCHCWWSTMVQLIEWLSGKLELFRLRTGRLWLQHSFDICNGNRKSIFFFLQSLCYIACATVGKGREKSKTTYKSEQNTRGPNFHLVSFVCKRFLPTCRPTVTPTSQPARFCHQIIFKDLFNQKISAPPR